MRLDVTVVGSTDGGQAEGEQHAKLGEGVDVGDM